MYHTYKSTAEYMEMPSYNLLFRHWLILASPVWVSLKVILMTFVTHALLLLNIHGGEMAY